jgi:hypothetical protein
MIYSIIVGYIQTNRWSITQFTIRLHDLRHTYTLLMNENNILDTNGTQIKGHAEKQAPVGFFSGMPQFIR